MIRFTIRDVLWLTVVVALAICWWTERRSLSRLSRQLKMDRKEWQLDRQRLERQRSTIESLTFENAQFAERVRKQQLLDEAKPGVYYLGPAKHRP